MRPLLPSLAVLALALTACERKAEETSGPAPVPEAQASPSDAAIASAGAAVDAVTTPAAGEQGGTDQWRKVANAEDQDRIARLDTAWTSALKEADVEYGAMIDAKGMLLVPRAALPGNLQPGPGTYRCRTIKVGSMDGKGLAYVEYPWFKCSVELTPGGDLILTKTTGSQRTRGLLYPDAADPNRLIFIGAQAWGMDEKGFPTYGQMPERDQVGVFERIGADRWRLVVPFPKQESKLDVLELKK
ncbi:DUF4893 domain-containing protein [Caulobacter sp. NIBR1757]|uniref:DUF4893 domain-containing protein n=1 Tax=Caulobacter sp. NIBR1757 TaxID=3016000 RepID=UPI0022F03C17|nr:DUF4893 domain-containing protein [Caulobacter sp. NIBR1757]